MRLTLTDEQRALLDRRKSVDLTIHEFLSVTLLQVRIQAHERDKEMMYQPALDALEDRIAGITLATPVQAIGKLNQEINELAREILKP